MKDTLLAIGEALIDFVPLQTGLPLKEVTRFERVCGGAPLNVAVAVARLGGKSSLLTKVGNDPFGDVLLDCLRDNRVDTSCIRRTCQAKTGLAFVSLDAEGNRDFSFYRHPSADLLLKPEEVTEEMLRDCAILHFGSVDLVESPMRKAHEKAISLAKEQGCLISFDPNVRLSLWDSPETCRSAILEFLTGHTDPDACRDHLLQDARLLLYTRGAQGCRVFTREHALEAPGIPVQAVDTTGAGDAFAAAFLYQLLSQDITKEKLETLTQTALLDSMRFANCYAALTTLRKGAVKAMATREELEAFLCDWLIEKGDAGRKFRETR